MLFFFHKKGSYISVATPTYFFVPINMKNELTRQGKYTDAVDDALIRFLKAKPKHM